MKTRVLQISEDEYVVESRLEWQFSWKYDSTFTSLAHARIRALEILEREESLDFPNLVTSTGRKIALTLEVLLFLVLVYLFIKE